MEAGNLKDIPLFHDLSQSMVEEFSAFFTKKTVAEGGVIFREKSAGDAMYIIVSGEVVIEKAMDEDGLEFKTLAIISGGDFFGEMSLIDGQPRFAQARASKDTELFEVERSKFFAFIKEHPETGINIFSAITRTISRRLQHTSNELTMLYDLSRQLLKQHKSPAAFLAAVMDEMRIYLSGSWNARGYIYNRFNEEYEEAYSRETFRRPAAFPLPARPEAGWADDNTYVIACSAERQQLAAAVFESSEALSPVEKNNLATIFNTISSILGSAIINIEHQVEAGLMEKLRKSKNTI